MSAATIMEDWAKVGVKMKKNVSIGGVEWLYVLKPGEVGPSPLLDCIQYETWYRNPVNSNEYSA